MENIIIGAVLAVLLGAAIAYVVHSKKKGSPCIGCPYSEQCTKSSCSDDSSEKV